MPKNPVWITGGGVTGPRVNQAALEADRARLDGELADGVERRRERQAHRPGDRRGEHRRPTRRSWPTSTRSGSTARRSAWRTSSRRPTCAASPPGRTRWATRRRGRPPARSTRACTSTSRRSTSTAPTASTPASPTTTCPTRTATNALAHSLAALENAIGFQGDDMLKYLGPGEDMMATQPARIYRRLREVRGRQAAERRDPRRRSDRRDPQRHGAGQRDLSRSASSSGRSRTRATASRPTRS